MAGLKEIRSRIKSVKSTRKITYAMKLVSAAKLGRAQEEVKNSRLYTNAINELLVQLTAEQEDGETAHPLTVARDKVKRVHLVVVGANKGLAGAYHSGVNKAIDAFFSNERIKSLEVSTLILGKKQAEHCHSRGYPVTESMIDLPDSPAKWPIEEICARLERQFIEEEADEVYLIYTRFKSAISQVVEMQKLLPMDTQDLQEQVGGVSVAAAGLSLFEPSVQEVFEEALPRVLRCQLRQASLDSKASEHGSRMTAMDSATKNAGDLIDALTLRYNKLRQSSITSEILDIVGGAEAQK